MKSSPISDEAHLFVDMNGSIREIDDVSTLTDDEIFELEDVFSEAVDRVVITTWLGDASFTPTCPSLPSLQSSEISNAKHLRDCGGTEPEDVETNLLAGFSGPRLAAAPGMQIDSSCKSHQRSHDQPPDNRLTNPQRRC